MCKLYWFGNWWWSIQLYSKISFFYLFFENCGTNSILASHDHNRFFIGIFEIMLNFMIINMAQPNTRLYMVFHQQIYIQHVKIEKLHWRWWILSIWVFPIIGCFFCFVFCSAAKWKTKNSVVPKSIDSFHGLTYYICPPIYAFFPCVLVLVTPCLLLAVLPFF